MSLPKRLPKEIADTQSAEMKASGIYYIHDEVNARLGRAMIFGPEGTPYAHCPLTFQFEFPANYPFEPPKVTFLTSDGVTRFHPNLYVGGKVCLSILGTWNGPNWVAVMTISTVLSSIQSLLEPNPITNEPGWEKLTLENDRARQYSEIVQARLVSHVFRNICRMRSGKYPPEWEGFEDVMAERGEGVFTALSALITEKASQGEIVYSNIVYSMGGTTEWGRLATLASSSKIVSTTTL